MTANSTDAINPCRSARQRARCLVAEREWTQDRRSPLPDGKLSHTGILTLLALLSAFIPLSTDMYLPALPQMAIALHAPTHLVTLTLVLFFLFYSVGALLWGPLSDKYGRKPVLLCGLALYVMASACCALAGNVYQLIVFRILQAIASGASPAIATALVKDLFEGRRRVRGLVLIQSMVMIAPLVAPVIGAFLLQFISWRGVFFTLAGFGVLALVWSFALRETVTQRYGGTIFQTLKQLGAVLRIPGFTVLLVIFSLISMPLFAYLASSSYIYINEFGLSALGYSYFFMGNAMSAVFAPFLYLQLSKFFRSQAIVSSCFAVIAVSGVLICLLGRLHPWTLALAIIPATMSLGIMRPPGTHLMLEQVHAAAGAASSLMICSMSILGSAGMLLMSGNWQSMIVPLGLVHTGAAIVAGGLWLAFSGRSFIRQPVHEIQVKAA
ncbi:MAG: multidrug effflux MFS transporter [Armatimonadota bacterium]